MLAMDRPVETLQARWAAPPSRFIPMDGMQVHVRDEGPSGDAEPIVLIHGTGSSLHTWDAWSAALKPAHRVIRLDRPGFGLTGPNPGGDYTMSYYADFMRRFLDGMGVERATLAGNSSGGRVAWEVAARNPDRVARLVLLASSGYPRTTPLPLGLRIAQSPFLNPLLSKILPRAAVGKGVRGTYGDPSKVTEELIDRNYEIMLRTGNRKALGATLSQADAVDDSALIRTIHAATLILWGTRDTVVQPADAQRFHADIAGSNLVMLPGIGHLAQEEDPEGTLAALRHFLSGTRSAPTRAGFLQKS